MDTRTLRRILRANAVFSELSGVVLLLGSAALDGALGLDAWFLMVVGGGLFAYGAVLWWLAGRADAGAVARLATVMDAVWVIGSVVILVGFPDAMTTEGRIALGAVSLVVLGFGEAQLVGLWRARAAARTVTA